MSQIELIENFSRDCPWCGTAFTVEIDNTASDHEFVEDCRICCAPILITVERDFGGLVSNVTASKENE